MKIIVIDNDVEEALRLVDYLGEAFPDYSILPESNSLSPLIFTDWSEVYSYLLGFPEESAVLCLDLALKNGKVDFHDVVRGLEQGEAIRGLKPGWVLVAYTMHGERAALHPIYKEAFDGMINKATLDPILHRKERISYVKRVLTDAINNRTGGGPRSLIPADVHIIDSLGMRSFGAAFGEAAIAEIIENEAGSWDDIELKALTTGHSGAFLLSITGRSLEGPRSLVLKVARDEKTIKDEIEAPVTYITQLGPLNGHLGEFDPSKRILTSTAGLYYRQALHDGQQLLELLRPGVGIRGERSLRAVVSLCLDVFRSIMPAQYAFASARDLFKLTPVDIGRLETSVDFIAEFGDTLAGRGFWPPALGEPQEVASDVVQMARGWSESNITQVNLPTVVQHGDLNPGNILIRDNQDSFPVLIDLSRLGRWPIGYDLSRLSLMLRLRLLDADGHRDWLPDGLRQWSQESVARLDRDSASNHYLCPEGQYCDDQYRLFLKDVGEPYNNTLALSYKLGTMWDLMKVISYQDMSPYKRVWAFIECWKLKGNLETMRVEGD